MYGFIFSKFYLFLLILQRFVNIMKLEKNLIFIIFNSDWAPFSQFASESITGIGFKFFEKKISEKYIFHKNVHLTFISFRKKINFKFLEKTN